MNLKEIFESLAEPTFRQWVAINKGKYTFTELLDFEYSVSGIWKSQNAKFKNIMADVVSLDSPLPIKDRGSIASAMGEIPKIGASYILKETQLKEIEIMQAQGMEERVYKRVLENAVAGLRGVYERLEAMFLEGVSTGFAGCPDMDNPGNLIRFNYGFEDSHRAGVKKLWNNPEEMTPISDIADFITSIDNSNVKVAYMDRTLALKLVQSKQMREIGSLMAPPIIGLEELKNRFLTLWGISLVIIDKKVVSQKSGKNKTLKPFDQNAIVFTKEGKLGTCFYTNLAEMSEPLPEVGYALADDYIMVAQQRTSNPLTETARAEAMAVPILDCAADTYILDTSKLQV